MCGIAGLVGGNHKDKICELIDSIKHRGPDAAPTYFHFDFVSIASCRLKIETPLIGNQPYICKPEGLVVTFNGEIYNYLYLSKVLLDHGVKLESVSEVEVIAKCFLVFGIQFVEKLDGMYAISILDIKNFKLFLIRDPTGIKPLYFSKRDDYFAYSSEIKSFFHSKLVADEISEIYLSHRFVFDFGPTGYTLFSDVKSLLPGNYLLIEFQNNQISTSTHPILFNSKNISIDLDPSSIKLLLNNAVRKRIPSSVNWGILLSGGIDSSILTYIAKNICEGAFDVYTLSDNFITEDLKSARIVADYVQVPLIELKPNYETLESDFTKYIYSIEEFEPNSFFWSIIAKEVKKETKVLICGQGADELFGGYPFYFNLKEMVALYNARFTKIKDKISVNSIYCISEKLDNISSPAGLEYFYRLFLEDQLEWFQLNILDKCTMAYGIEARVPFLDLNLLQFMSSYSLDSIISPKIEKSLLREAFKSTGLPNIMRRKQFSGNQTVPTIYKNLNKISEFYLSDKHFDKHQYSSFFNNKLEMMGFDILNALFSKSELNPTDGISFAEIFKK